MTREEAIYELQEDKALYETDICHAGDGTPDGRLLEALDMAIEALQGIPLSEQYKKGFEDAERAFLVEYAREAENMRKRSVQLEVMLNAQKAISPEAVQVVRCKDCQYRKKIGTLYYCDLDEFNVKDTDYCSWGEKREEVNGFKSVRQAWNTSQGRWEL